MMGIVSYIINLFSKGTTMATAADAQTSFSKLVDAIAGLLAKFTDINNQLAAANTENAALKAQVADLQAQVDSFKTESVALDGLVATFDSQADLINAAVNPPPAA